MKELIQELNLNENDFYDKEKSDEIIRNNITPFYSIIEAVDIVIQDLTEDNYNLDITRLEKFDLKQNCLLSKVKSEVILRLPIKKIKEHTLENKEFYYNQMQDKVEGRLDKVKGVALRLNKKLKFIVVRIDTNNIPEWKVN